MSEDIKDLHEQGVVDPDVLTDAEDARFEELDRQGRLSPDQIRAQILSERPKSNPVSHGVVEHAVWLPQAEPTRPEAHDAADIQPTDEAPSLFILEPTDSHPMTEDERAEQVAERERFQAQGDENFRQRLIDGGMNAVEATARMRARQELRDRGRQ